MKKYDGILDRDNVANNCFIFKPKTALEAEQMQKNLFALGAEWADGVNGLRFLADCVEFGFNCTNGVMKYKLNDDMRANGLLCTLDQFRSAKSGDLVQAPAEEVVTKTYLREVFNELAEKVKAQNIIIERQTQLIEKLYAAAGGDRILDKQKITRKSPPKKGSGS